MYVYMCILNIKRVKCSFKIVLLQLHKILKNAQILLINNINICHFFITCSSKFILVISVTYFPKYRHLEQTFTCNKCDLQ